MTQAGWLSCTDPQAMLSVLLGRGPVSPRKLRLFAVACCRDVWDLIEQLEEAGIGLGCPAVLIAERCADGLAQPREVNQGFEDFVGLIDSGSSPESQLLQGALPALANTPERAATDAARHAARARYQDVKGRAMRGREERGGASAESLNEARAALVATLARQADLLRCVFGPPLAPASLDPGWRTEAVAGLTIGMYGRRDFTPLPVLADALEDAGCVDEDVLAHCRGPGSHVRGCWVVDGLLNLA